MKEMLAKLYDYDCWANAIIFDHAAQLSDEEDFAPSAFGSLHRVLVHLVAVEEMWRTLTQYGGR